MMYLLRNSLTKHLISIHVKFFDEFCLVRVDIVQFASPSTYQMFLSFTLILLPDDLRNGWLSELCLILS
jgi:hypothetical protein